MAATRQNYDEREYEYDGYDDGYDDEPEDEAAGGDSGLLPLDSGSMSVSLGGGGGDGWDAATAYSRINAREAEITFTALIDFLKNYRPKQHRTTILINGLVRLAMRILNAPACRRQLRFEAEESRARYWMNRLGKDGQAPIEAADALLDRWGSADLLQIEIRHRRLRQGLAAVEPERARWYTAIRKKELAEQAATKLPSAAYEYFRCRLEQYAHPARAGRGPGQGAGHRGLLRRHQAHPQQGCPAGGNRDLDALALPGSHQRGHAGRGGRQPPLEPLRADGGQHRAGQLPQEPPLGQPGGRRRACSSAIRPSIRPCSC